MHRIVIHTLFSALLAIAAAPALLDAQTSEGVNTAEEQEVLAAMRSYFTAYAEKDVEWLEEEMFTTPYIGFSADGPAPELTQEARSARVERVIGSLDEEGWAGGEYLDPSVCIINPSTAFVSGAYNRYRADGSVLNEHGGTYFFVRSEGRWRMVAYAPHDVGLRLECVR